VDTLVRQQPEQAWLMALRLVELSPDDQTLANVAAGPLEDLLKLHPYAFIDRVEHQIPNRCKIPTLSFRRVGLVVHSRGRPGPDAVHMGVKTRYREKGQRWPQSARGV
jgi:hypothetical protein